MAFTTIIFDFFGVICSEIAPYWLANYFAAEDASHIKSTLIHSADEGQISQTEMFNALGVLVNLDANTIRNEWLSYVRIDERMVTLIENLKEKYKIGLLTNSPAPLVRHIIDLNNLEKLFDAIIVSSEVGHAKPAAPIYHKMLNALNVAAEDSLFVDDNPINLAGAEKLGINTLIYSSFDNFQSELDALI